MRMTSNRLNYLWNASSRSMMTQQACVNTTESNDETPLWSRQITSVQPSENSQRLDWNERGEWLDGAEG